MKRILLSLGLSAAFLMPAFADGEKLIGTWKSDKKSTLEYLKQHTRLSPEELAKLDPVLGKMVLVYDGKTVTAQDGDSKSVVKYVIIREFEKAITIQTIDPKTKNLEQTRLEFDDNGYWVSEDKIPGFKERFEKLTAK